jgi:hypothetical protein
MFLLTCSTQTLAQTGNPVGSREVSPLQNLIESRLNFITENQRFVSQLTAADLIDLPVGIAPKIGDKTVVIAIDSAYFFDCNGFKSFNLKGLFSLSKAYFVPDPLMAKGDTVLTSN